MKKYFLTSLCSLICADAAMASVNWWNHDTICKPSNARCYANMGAGFDVELWDTTGDCRGMKLICPLALKDTDDKPIAMNRADIKSGTKISNDFDVTVLNTADGCFGMRKTTANGAQVSVNGRYVNVWCPGILDDVDETIDNGEITYGAQPTCNELAEDGYVAIVNNRCYGKYYDPSQYFIECTGSEIRPSRIITLNGADYNSNSNAPVTQAIADTMFDAMYQTSQTQHQKYFQK